MSLTYKVLDTGSVKEKKDRIMCIVGKRVNVK